MPGEKGAPAKRMHVAVHDVAPPHLARLERIHGVLERYDLAGRHTLLVVPDFHRRGRADRDPVFVRWLRTRVAAGAEVFLHGFSHLDEQRHRGVRERWLARTMTGGEGEFLGLERRAAAARLAEGRRIVEDAAGCAVDGFVAPAWLYGSGVRAALAEAGFRIAEDHATVWSPIAGRRLAFSPVVNWASRTPARLASSVLWSRLAALLLRPLRLVRVSIHPHDADQPVLVQEIERTLAAFRQDRLPILLRELLPP